MELMKLNLARETLLKPLQLVIGVVERKQTLPILSNVLLNRKDNKLSVTGTDLEVELIGQALLDNDSESPSQLTVPGRKLMDICRALPDNAAIELYQDKEQVILRSGRSRFTLSTLPANDFPNIEEQEGHLKFTIAQQLLRNLLTRTHFAMAHQDVRYYLNGLLLEMNAGLVRAVATDGHRLAMNTIKVPAINEVHRIQIIIPRKGITELLRLLEDVEDKVDIMVSNNHIRVSTDHYVFTSKLIEGRFPDYDRVIPRSNDKTITINREELKQALSRSAILCNEKFRGVRFEIKPQILKILANNPEQEAAEEEIAIDYQKENIDIGFNVNYLIDILNILKSENVTLNLSDSNSSMLIEEHGNKTDSVFVVMPMRL